jgi:tRNA U55 pseudouridine synthase TruB
LTLDAEAETARARLLPIETAVAELPRFVLPEGDLKRLGQGQPVDVDEGHAWTGEEGEAAVFDEAGRLAAVARFDPRRHRLQPAKVIQSRNR